MYRSDSSYKAKVISENNEKIKKSYKTNNKIKSNKTKFKENIFFMSEDNTCIAEPNLKVPFA